MTFIRTISLIIVFGCSDSTETPVERPAEDIIQNVAFVHANVVTMQDETILFDQTVLVENGKIKNIEKDLSVPDGFFTIDASNQFLMPGLADMHTHINYQEDLMPYLANGVTTVLNMGSPSAILSFKAKTSNLELPGPSIYASAFVDGSGNRGWVIRTPEEAATDIAQIKSMGWDFVKVYNSIRKDVFVAIATEASKNNLAIVGHGVREPGMNFIISNGQVMVAHMEEFLYTSFVNSRDAGVVNEVTTFTKNAGTYVTPNLSAYEAISKQWGNPAGLTQLMQSEGIQYVSPKWKTFWQNLGYTSNSGSIQANLQFLRSLTKQFSDAGIPLLLGSDSPYVPGLPPGFSIHDDLRNMVESGLTPFKAILAGTKTSGEFISKYVPGITPFGLVKEGYRADLILLSANPLQNINNIKKRVGVMAAGRWTSEKWLKDRLEELKN